MALRKSKFTDDTSPFFDLTDDLLIIGAPVVTGEVSLASQFASQAAPALAPLDDPFCPRQIIFTIPGQPGVQVTATENNGKIDFIVDVLNDPTSTGDLRGLFFHFNESKLATLQITGTDVPNWITGTQISANHVIDLLDGVNMNGAAKPFDVGIRFGTPGTQKDDLYFPLHFTLSDAANDLTLDDFAHLEFGARLNNIGGPGGPRGGVSKITGIAPAAPQAADDPATTHEDQSVTIHPLGNDHDGDGDALTITSVHLEAGAHGTVTIAADGQSFVFTPDKDYAGPNFISGSTDASFEYCVSDGHGGQDSATVKVHIIPVADQPTITFDVLPAEAADPINMVRLKITAAQSDADGSEFIDRIEFGALPAGVTLISDGNLNPGDQPDSIVKFVQLMLPTAQQANFQDISFDFNVTAYAQEEGNGDPDEASATAAKHISVDFTHNQTHQTFDAIDQSIWTTGSGAPFTWNKFIGPDIPFNESQTFFPPPPALPVPIDAFAEGHFKVGLQVNVTFDGGHITAHLPYDITIDTTYNETTDSLLIQTGATLASGANFTTTGPEGSVNFDFVIDFLAKIGLEDGIAGIVGVDETFALQPAPFHLFDLSSTGSDLPYTVPLPGGLSIILDWPHLSGGSTGQSGNEVLGDASSNPFIKLNLDVDAAAAFYFPPFQLIESVIDPDPTSDTNFELFDLDVNANANLLQKFVLDALKLDGALTFENGQTFNFKVGDDLPIIRNASSLDGPDSNNTIDFALAMTPDATLDNETSVGLNVGGQLGLIKNLPGDLALFDEGLNIPVASIPVYDTDPFKLNFNSGSYDFVV